MNFEIVCPNCGALSSPAVGVCPYCKSAMTTETEKHNPTLATIKKLYNDGQTDRALVMAKSIETQKPELLKDVDFAILYAKILFEVDGPSSKTRAVLGQAFSEHPANPHLAEYMEVVEAETNLSHEKSDAGAQELAQIIRRSPENVYALFFLGSHLYWVEKDSQQALRYLERCVRLRPNFVRAKACLAVVYKELGMRDAAARLLNDCATKTFGSTRQFFQNFAQSA
ncbi:MAG: hypothetical protein HQL20_04990 [Candidatus Omnitrophica bacterium]|nr:hypothetical protein [Candidatus Omnitrophota bacterium]